MNNPSMQAGRGMMLTGGCDTAPRCPSDSGRLRVAMQHAHRHAHSTKTRSSTRPSTQTGCANPSIAMRPQRNPRTAKLARPGLCVKHAARMATCITHGRSPSTMCAAAGLMIRRFLSAGNCSDVLRPRLPHVPPWNLLHTLHGSPRAPAEPARVSAHKTHIHVSKEA